MKRLFNGDDRFYIVRIFGLWYLILALVLCQGAGSVTVSAASSSVTSDSIKEKEEQISQKKEEKESLKDGLQRSWKRRKRT